MSLLSNLFSSKPDYPQIDPASAAAKRVAEVEAELEELANKVSDTLEVVPSEHAAYVFLGKPPKKFGLAWIHDGKISGLNTLVEEHGMKPQEIEKIVDELRTAYEKHTDVSRYCTEIHNHTFVVTPSPQLESEVHEIIDRIIH